jgi:subtilisin family serine protease
MIDVSGKVVPAQPLGKPPSGEVVMDQGCPHGVEHDVVHGCERMGWQPPEGRRTSHYLYRSGQLLVSADEELQARSWLGDHGVAVGDGEEPDDRVGGCLEKLGLSRIRVDESQLSVPQIIPLMDAVEGPRVRPNHVLVAAFHFHVGPATLPQEATAEELGDFPRINAAEDPRPAPKVLVLDTGIVRGDLPQEVKVRCEGKAEVIDPTKPLPRAGGHGTFVAGLICKHTEITQVEVRDVIDECGFVDDVALATSLDEVGDDVDILNLSLGGYGFDGDMAVTVAQLKALTFRNPELVIVAAAGNDGTDVPFLPAALPNVISVAAVTREGKGKPERACFSNYGPWVDACAEGVDRVSTFLEFKGELATYEPPHACRGDQQPGATAAAAPEAVEREFERRAKWSGTSFAAPLVTAAIAQRMETEGQTAREAARDLVFDRRRSRRPGLGVFVEPKSLQGQAAPGTSGVTGSPSP